MFFRKMEVCKKMENIKELMDKIDKYNADSEIPQHLWNKYMKVKYGKDYFLMKEDVGTYCIKCLKKSGGRIEPYSIKKQILMFVSDLGMGTGKANNINTVLPDWCIVERDGDGIIFRFPENKLVEVGEFIFLRKKKQLTEEQKEILRERFKKNIKKKDL